VRTTIDKAGRVVIPAPLREKAGFSAGAELEFSVDEQGIRLERVAEGPRLVRIGRRLVARPRAAADSRPSGDVGALIEEERNRWP
jgi:AbrB family looped-hinge helix DNA binding protein